MKKIFILTVLAAGVVTLLSFTLLPNSKKQTTSKEQHESRHSNDDGYAETNQAKW